MHSGQSSGEGLTLDMCLISDMFEVYGSVKLATRRTKKSNLRLTGRGK